MKFIAQIIFSILVNALAIWVAAYFIQGFIFQGNWVDLLIAALILTIINTFVRPILKLLLGPIIVLTLGAFSFAINIVTLYLLDIFSVSITINGLTPLLLATVIISLVNILINSITKLKT